MNGMLHTTGQWCGHVLDPDLPWASPRGVLG